MKRALVWLQLIIGWLPVWMLYTTMIVAAHPGTGFQSAVLISLRAITCAAVLGLAVYRLTERLPWPYPIGWRFVAAHLVAAPLYAVAWVLLITVVEFLLHGALHGSEVVLLRLPLVRYLVMGLWLYIMVTGVAYAISAAERAAKAEAAAARSSLAALRAQLNPHFLFNALHTVVQLIPREPKLAAQAAEQLGALLRTSIEEDRDLVLLSEEWGFVERFLEVERIRFGDRLRVRSQLSAGSGDAMLPSFAVQTLVENAVRHGVEPRVEPTDISIEAQVTGGALTVTVRDTGGGASDSAVASSTGTGLARLRERLAVLYGGAARLEISTGATSGFTATLVVPQTTDEP
jgi:sensor histidine kinase YesM